MTKIHKKLAVLCGIVLLLTSFPLALAQSCSRTWDSQRICALEDPAVFKVFTNDYYAIYIGLDSSVPGAGFDNTFVTQFTQGCGGDGAKVVFGGFSDNIIGNDGEGIWSEFLDDSTPPYGVGTRYQKIFVQVEDESQTVPVELKIPYSEFDGSGNRILKYRQRLLYFTPNSSDSGIPYQVSHSLVTTAFLSDPPGCNAYSGPTE
jgi:hypothetical protein